jgi:hypothetical protein
VRRALNSNIQRSIIANKSENVKVSVPSALIADCVAVRTICGSRWFIAENIKNPVAIAPGSDLITRHSSLITYHSPIRFNHLLPQAVLTCDANFREFFPFFLICGERSK